jgi:trk system potassium uptake protein TrkH
MLVRPRAEDHRVVGKYTGKIIVGTGLLMVIPLIVALLYAEWDTALDFGISMAVATIVGLGLQLLCRTDEDVDWSHALVVAAGSWIMAMVLGAMPYWLSRQYGSYLDCMFDVMSGYTTTGLYLIQDLDHVAMGLNMWRHVLTYAGGQGIIVIALTFLVRNTGGAFKLYVGEGKDEKLVPNVVHTARAIWLVSLTWLALGTLALGTSAYLLGESADRAFFHGMWVTMGGWSTGGFAPQSYNTFWFHSFVFELMTIVIFVAGSFNFALHWSVWNGDRREIRRNIETVSFATTLLITTALVSAGLALVALYPDVVGFFRKAFYLVSSGHTTTGFMTIYSRSFVTQWGPIAMMGVTVAMALGACACSTAGGIKAIRIGVITKAMRQDVHRLISPEHSVVAGRYHHVRDVILGDAVVRAVMATTVTYLLMYAVMTIIGTLAGYNVAEAAFEGVSAAANTGLSCGVTSPSMPWAMKAFFIVAMWMGRLEFTAVFALAGYAFAMVRGR